MPTNLYGPNDYFNFEHSHVIPGLLSRMHKAKIDNDEKFFIWGSGSPFREFLYVDDLSNAIEFLLDKNLNIDLLNVGSGHEITIKNLSELIKKTIGYEGELAFDKNIPDGNPRKLLDSKLINKLGWKPATTLEIGLKNTYDWFLENFNSLKK